MHKRGYMATLALAAAVLGCSSQRGSPDSGGTPERIISLAPSITETVFALGCGERLVGVTSFCSYPAQARSLPKLGGYTNPNYEALLLLKPDLVILLEEHKTVQNFCRERKIAFLAIDNDSVAAILRSIESIGRACGSGAASDGLVSSIRKELGSGKTGGPRPRVLFCIDRAEPGGGRIAKLFVAGRSTFYAELVEAAGGVNAYQDITPRYPSLSAEGLMGLAPDVIVDISKVPSVGENELCRDWDMLSLLPAVENQMVFCITDDYMTAPGPRIVLILRRLRKIIARWHESRSCAASRSM